MKKIAFFPLISMLLLFLASCTLDMDEWIEAEENKGYDEVEEVKNDYLTLKYKYKPTTRSLTESIQEYIVQVENDSILYFMENTPDEWLPKPGGYVVSNCCLKFPMGLMGRVLSVDKVNGLIKVVVADAELRDIYDEFDLYLDTDLLFGEKEGPDTVEASSRQNSTRGVEGGKKEIVIRDWAMFNATTKGEKKITRSLSDEYEKDVNYDKVTDEGEIIIYHLTNDDPIAKAIIKKSKDYVNVIDLTISSISKTKMQKIVELKKEREYTKTTTSSGYKISGVIGKDLLKDKTDEAKKNAVKKMSEWIKSKKGFPEFSEKLKQRAAYDDEDYAFVIEIPMGAIPFGLVIRLMPTFSCELGLYGKVEIKLWQSSEQLTTECVNGKKTMDKKDEVAPPSNEWFVSAYGNFHLGGGGELWIGAGKKLGKKAVGIGGFVSATLDFNINVPFVSAGDYSIASATDFIGISANGKFGGKILAGFFGDIEFFSYPFKIWDGYQYPVFPKVKFGNSIAKDEQQDNKGKYYEHHLNYHFSEMGVSFSSVLARISGYKPILNIYTTPNMPVEFPSETLYASNFSQGQSLKSGRDYEFIYKNRSGKDVYAVAGYEDPYGIQTLFADTKFTATPTARPNIKYELVYDDDLKKYDYFWQVASAVNHIVGPTSATGPMEYDEFTYTFVLPFTLRNASVIDNYWSDWGVYFRVSGNALKQAVGRYVSLKNSIKKSGKYAIKSCIRTSVDTEKSPLGATAYVYYKDKETGKIHYINSPDEVLYSYEWYDIVKSSNAKVLNNTIILFSHSGDDDYTDDYVPKEYKIINKY